MKLDCIVIQFARFPTLGGVKTRLHPELGKEGCLALYLQLLKHVHDQVQQSDLFHVISLDGTGNHPLVNSLMEMTPMILQQGGDLGERMFNAIEWGLTKANKVIIIGSDCAVLNQSHLNAVKDALNDHSHTFIPAEDGGYVLVGATESYRDIFENIEWGINTVMEKTKQAIESGNKKAAYLPLLWDVDRPEDYHRLLDCYPNWPELKKI
jgi:rSAM/selenodomain-associated transferase 1